MIDTAREPAQRIQLETMFQPYKTELAAYVLSGKDKQDLEHRASRYLDLYWSDSSRTPYLISDGSTSFGFCLVNRHSVLGGDVASIAEFYILPPYRRLGHGKDAAENVIARHGPDWEVAVLSSNSAADAFWRAVIGNVSRGPEQRFFQSGEDGIERIIYRFTRSIT